MKPVFSGSNSVNNRSTASLFVSSSNFCDGISEKLLKQPMEEMRETL